MSKHIWYAPQTDIESSDAIHQILMYGTLPEISYLKKQFGEEKLQNAFLKNPKKIYTPAALNFIKTFILHIHSNIDEQQYLKTTLRNIG